MNHVSLDAYLTDKLSKRDQQHLLRTRRAVNFNTDGVISADARHFLDFASNDYLGLRNHPEVLQAWVNGLAQYGGGSGASPLVTGYYEAHQAFEKSIANALQRDAALVFSSGFAANQALTRALFADGGLIVADKLMHASFIDGALASKAQFKRFAHNDMEALERLLAATKDTVQGPRMIATEGVFSMDGDTPPIDALVILAQQYGCTLMLDEAHALGVLGADGMGTIAKYKLTQAQVPIVMGTLGKAFGTGGAFIAGSQALIDFLVNFARDYIYSTAFPPAQAVASVQALALIQQGDLTRALHKNIQYFKQLAAQQNIPLMVSNSAIQLVPVGCPSKARQLGSKLEDMGIWLGVMRSPTVPVGTDRLRITLRADHNENDIKALIDALSLSLATVPQGDVC